MQEFTPVLLPRQLGIFTYLFNAVQSYHRHLHTELAFDWL